MMQMPPIFVKGELSFELDGGHYAFPSLNLSAFGVTGLDAPTLNPKEHFGRVVQAHVRVLTPELFTFQTTAHLIREFTDVSERVGIRFELDSEIKNTLIELIEKHGFLPTEYIRKYPRIPSTGAIQTFPLRAQVMPLAKGSHKGLYEFPIIFDVENLSPNGVLLRTENQMALSVLPKDHLDIVLEPRGWFPMQVRVVGVVCRVYDEVHAGNLNLSRYLGVKFSQMDDINRAAFLDLLRDILGRLKERAESVGRPGGPG